MRLLPSSLSAAAGRVRYKLGAAASYYRSLGRPGPEAYAAGKPLKSDLDWMPQGLGPNALADQYLDTTRKRVRDLIDSNPHLDGCCKTICNNVAGCTPHPATRWRTVNDRIKELWFRDAEGVDLSRERTVLESEKLFIREVFGGGECLVHFPNTAAFRRFAAGPAVELIEAERIPMDAGLSAVSRRALSNLNGGRLRQGVEFDAYGRRVAYHVFKDHPDDAGIFNFARVQELRRIDALDARLAFVERRTKQIRGIPWAVSVVGAAKLTEGWDEATILLAFMAACVQLQAEGVKPDQFLQSSLINAADQPVRKLTPGGVLFTKTGSKVNILSPNLPAPSYPAAMEVCLRRIAAGLNISYAALARDYSKATFSATRAESLEDRMGYRDLQEFVWTSHTGELYRRKIDFWIATGELKLPEAAVKAYLADRSALYACTVGFKGWEWVNPAQEAVADQIAVEQGFKSIGEVCRARGRHAEDVIDEQVALEVYEKEAREKAGLPPRAKSNIALTVASGDGGEGGNGKEEKSGGDTQDPPPKREDDGQARRPGGRLARFFGLNGASRANGVSHGA